MGCCVIVLLLQRHGPETASANLSLHIPVCNVSSAEEPESRI